MFSSKNIFAQGTSTIERAGLRSSVYGFKSFPDTTWWFNSAIDMASRFVGAAPSVIWILGYTTNDGCYLNFPNPYPDSSFSKIFFSSKDENENYLNFFDRKGIKVWLQVEPGFADVSKLIDLALSQYSHHSSVIGFGIDAEWYKTSTANNEEGEAVTDSEAAAWSIQIKSYNQDYLFFTKHWLVEKMPPSFKKDIVFVDDSQIFPNLNSMANEFEAWANFFSPAKVAFQFGYESDKKWWGNLSNPPETIGDELLKRCSNISDLYWVDFTAYDIWPKDFTPTSIMDKNADASTNSFVLKQNYPNPFNPSTKIKYTIPYANGLHSSNLQHVIIKIYDILGKEVETLVDEEKFPGTYEATFSGTNLNSGVYYYKLITGSFEQSKKMLLIK